MKDKINEGALCVLIRNSNTDEVDLDYINYANPLETELNELKQICNSNSSSLHEIVEFIQKSHAFNVLSKEINYCEELDKPYQRITIKNDVMIAKIRTWIRLARN